FLLPLSGSMGTSVETILLVSWCWRKLVKTPGFFLFSTEREAQGLWAQQRASEAHGDVSASEEMCLGWRPTFRSSTSFLPKEPSLELPTAFTRKPSNNTLDLGAWPDHKHGLPRPENHPSGSLAH
ncbi:unnamed protein product, partial [Rangifer tarandus platyrhynchus]